MVHSFNAKSIHSIVKVFTIFVRKMCQNKHDDACYGSHNPDSTKVIKRSFIGNAICENNIDNTRKIFNILINHFIFESIFFKPLKEHY